MSLVNLILERMTRRRMRAMDRASANPEAAQHEQLKKLLARAADTEWGRQFGYSSIHDARTFRERVPLQSYEDLQPHWHRAFRGDRDVTWPGHIKYFALSSGTTSGNKLLPVSIDNIRANRVSGLSVAAHFLALTGDRTFARGKSLYLAGSAPLRKEGESLIGDASGIMLQFTPKLAQRYRLPTPEISSIGNWTEKIARIVDASIDEDIRLVSACPSWVLILFEEILKEGRKRYGSKVQTVRDVWKNLGGVVHFGMAWQPYRKALDRMLGTDVVHMDTFSASEGGMFAITDRRGADDMRLVIDNGIFYEFIPFDEIESERPTRLSLAEVEEDRVYEMVLNTNSGIWAYRLGDLVRFTSTKPHRVMMVGRSKLNLNAFGEHVIIEEMEAAVQNACATQGAECAEFTVLPVFPERENEKPYHRWFIEFRKEPADIERFGVDVDRSIRERNEDYDTHRTDDYGLAPPRIERLADGTFYRWMESRGKLGGQHKIPRVLREKAMSDDLLAQSR